MQRNGLIAICGLNCGDCDIYQAGNEPELARRISDWYKRERKRDVPLAAIRCFGCIGDRTQHWSKDCEILKCAMEQRGLLSCSECSEFPCDRLTKWASRNEKYREGLARLSVMAGKT